LFYQLIQEQINSLCHTRTKDARSP